MVFSLGNLLGVGLLASLLTGFGFELVKTLDEPVIFRIRTGNSLYPLSHLLGNVSDGRVKVKVKKDISYFYKRPKYESNYNAHLVLETPALTPFASIQMKYDGEVVKSEQVVEYNKDWEEINVPLNSHLNRYINGVGEGGVSSNYIFEQIEWLEGPPLEEIWDDGGTWGSSTVYQWVNDDLFLSFDIKDMLFYDEDFTLSINNSNELIYKNTEFRFPYISDIKAQVGFADEYVDSEYSYFNYDINHFNSNLVKVAQANPKEISRAEGWSDTKEEELTFQEFKEKYKNSIDYQKWLNYLEEKSTGLNEVIKVRYKDGVENIVEKSDVRLTGKGKLEWNYQWDDYLQERVETKFPKEKLVSAVNIQEKQPNSPNKPDNSNKKWYQQTYFLISVIVITVFLFLGGVIFVFILRRKKLDRIKIDKKLTKK